MPYAQVEKKVGVLTLIADVLKGVIPVTLALQLEFSQSQVLIVALAAFFGHIFPVYLKFKGGKGVATMFGVLLPWIPLTAVFTFAAWFILFKITRYVSLASIGAAFVLPFIAWFSHDSDAALIACLVVGGAVAMRHHDNVSRLIAGTESKT
ncbi:MAG: glycerol-3-phosphate 1-O-acyltransferase PlsY [Ghiorsea sp.]|nr:glycerol-3-phosphate 1-O-acyltransferase PlsY [Ghiorsea sp.]